MQIYPPSCTIQWLEGSNPFPANVRRISTKANQFPKKTANKTTPSPFSHAHRVEAPLTKATRQLLIHRNGRARLTKAARQIFVFRLVEKRRRRSCDAHLHVVPLRQFDRLVPLVEVNARVDRFLDLVAFEVSGHALFTHSHHFEHLRHFLSHQALSNIENGNNWLAENLTSKYVRWDRTQAAASSGN